MTNKPVVILIHGFNVTDPDNSVGKLTKHFQEGGFFVRNFNYGYASLRKVRLRNGTLAKKLARIVKEYKADGRKVAVVGHSNGCTIMRIAANRWSMPADVATCLNPALKRDEHPAQNVPSVTVFHNEQDKVVTWSKWLRRLTWFASRARPWGEMGRYGYLGDCEGVVNICTAHDFSVAALGHSGIFTEIDFFGPIIVETVSHGLRQG